MHQEIIVLGGFLALSSYYLYATKRINEEDRAAETTIPDDEKKTLLGQIEPTMSRPATLPPPAFVASTFNNVPGSYFPVSDTLSTTDAETEIKSLNIANRFLYG